MRASERRRLSAEERALWDKVKATVTPIRAPAAQAPAVVQALPAAVPAPPPPRVRGRVPPPLPPPPAPAPTSRPLDRDGLDGTWERRLSRGLVAPDFTLDLHGHTLDSAHARLDHGLTLALAQQARLVLVIAGKPRPADAADRGSRRGAIRAKLLDWLAAGPHAGHIAAVRGAHPRHGGTGAVYVVLRRGR